MYILDKCRVCGIHSSIVVVVLFLNIDVDIKCKKYLHLSGIMAVKNVYGQSTQVYAVRKSDSLHKGVYRQHAYVMYMS